MNAFVQAFLLVVSGCVLFCLPLAAVGWYTGERRRLWVASALWAALTALLATSTVIVVGAADNPADVTVWFSLRHTLVGLSLLAFFWVLAELSGQVPKLIIASLILVLLVRDILWFSTDLVWTHTFDASGTAIYGPLRAPFIWAIGILALLGIIYTTTRVWESSSARSLTLYFLVPAVIAGTIATTLTETLGSFGELLSVVVFAFPILIIQATLLHRSTLHTRRLERLRGRDAQLTKFAAQALQPGAGIPARGAIDLLTATLGEGRYAYFECVDDEPKLVAQSLGEPMSVTSDSLAVPIVLKGRTAAELVVGSEVDDDDRIFVRSVGFVLSAVLARSEVEDEARHHALHNSLTGLPNWLLLQDRLARLLASRGERTVAVWCCDVIDMKAINDDLGHRAGDAVLQEIGTRLRGIVGPSATVAHIGADKFVVAMLVTDEKQAVGIWPGIAGIAHLPIDYEGRNVRFGVRIGLAISDPDDTEVDADRLIGDAEMALMQAKRRGSIVATYDAVARKELDESRRVLRGLERAIHNDEFFVEYQPIVNLATGAIDGVEALARWRTPAGDLISPEVFIPAAEDNSMIMTVTRRVFHEALRQLDEWGRADPVLAQLRISLNLPPQVAVSPDLTGWLMAILREYQIAPHRLTLELTESAAISAPEGIIARMDELHSKGIAISLDDFGTGHSSFSRLMALPVDELKIDRMFTQAPQGPHYAIVPAVIGLARGAGLRVVAEGIATKEQLQTLLDLHCDYGQGYLFSRPVPPGQIPGLVASGEALLAQMEARVIG